MSASRDGILLCALMPALALACAPADPPAPETAQESAPAAAPGAEKPSLESFLWLLGEWQTEQDGKTMHELWTHQHPALLLGLHRDVSASGETVFFEYLRIEDREDGLVFLGAPQGQPPTVFRLETLEPARAVFVNPEHDYPQRISYWLADGNLHARIEGETPEGKKSSEWVFRDADE